MPANLVTGNISLYYVTVSVGQESGRSWAPLGPQSVRGRAGPYLGARLWEEPQEPAQWVKSSQDSASMSDALGADCRVCPSGAM